jgi:hypothetical protein
LTLVTRLGCNCQVGALLRSASFAAAAAAAVQVFSSSPLTLHAFLGNFPGNPAAQVDVTTEETDASGAQLNLADNGARAVIGGSSLDWYGQPAGGVAYVNTFGNTYYDPGALCGGLRTLQAAVGVQQVQRWKHSARTTQHLARRQPTGLLTTPSQHALIPPPLPQTMDSQPLCSLPSWAPAPPSTCGRPPATSWATAWG